MGVRVCVCVVAVRERVTKLYGSWERVPMV